MSRSLVLEIGIDGVGSIFYGARLWGLVALLLLLGRSFVFGMNLGL